MSSTCLELLGWNPRPQFKGPRPARPFVACLSHTSGVCEFILFWLYCRANAFMQNSCLVIAEQGFQGLQHYFHIQPLKWVMDQINVVMLSDKRWKSPQNYVERIVERVQQDGYDMVIIAPTGNTRRRCPWKSGYYHIGRKLGWGFRVVGFDFETKRLKTGPLVEPGQTLDATQKLLKEHMGDIAPLWVRSSSVKIRTHDPGSIGFTSGTAKLSALWLVVAVVALKSAGLRTTPAILVILAVPIACILW